MVAESPEQVEPAEPLRELETIPGCVHELIQLLDMTKSRKRGKGWEKPTLNESQMRAIRERRQCLQTLLKVAQSRTVEQLTTENEALVAENDRYKKKRQGHAERLDDARTPRTRKSRAKN